MTSETKFKAWMRFVDALLEKTHGVNSDDLPDMPWWDWYESEMTHQEAVNAAINIINEDGWW